MEHLEKMRELEVKEMELTVKLKEAEIQAKKAEENKYWIQIELIKMKMVKKKEVLELEQTLKQGQIETEQINFSYKEMEFRMLQEDNISNAYNSQVSFSY